MRKGSGDIRKVGDLFEKYRRTLVAPQKTVVMSFCEVVEELLNIKIDPKQVRYTTGSKALSLSSSGPLRSEVQLHKNEILAHMKGRLGEKNAPKEIL